MKDVPDFLFSSWDQGAALPSEPKQTPPDSLETPRRILEITLFNDFPFHFGQLPTRTSNPNITNTAAATTFTAGYKTFILEKESAIA